MKFTYPAVFKTTEEGVHVHFPDLEMCEAFGEDYEHALINAKEAEREWLELEVQEETMDIPFVSDINDIELAENEKVQMLSVNIRFMEGWDE